MKIKNNVVLDYKKVLNDLSLLGVEISDYSFAVAVIKIISPVRLKKYLCEIKDEITFEKLVELYNFDRELRNLLLFVLESIEISLRNEIALFFKSYYDGYSYLNPNIFETEKYHSMFITSLNESINRSLKDKHDFDTQSIINEYGFLLPIDIAVEYFSFGMLSKFYSNMKELDKQNFRKICHYSPSFLKSAMRCLTYLRNSCAHAVRIYGKVFPFIPKIPNKISVEKANERKLWHYIIALYLLFPEKEKWNEDFYDRLIHIIQKYNITLSHIGFPADYATFFQKEEFLEFLNY